MKSSLIIEDFTSWGQMSMTSALTINQSYGIYTAALPVQLFSTQTEGFGIPRKLSSLDWLQETMNHWKSNDITHFNSTLVGYLGENWLVEFVDSVVRAGNCGFLIVDPVMGDQGRLYPGLNDAYIKSIKVLASKADLITPNVTELALLTDMPITEDTELSQIQSALSRCQDQFNHCRVIVTGIPKNGETGCMWLEDGDFKVVMSSRVEGHFYGTGDLFSSILNALLVQHVSWPLQKILEHTVKLVSVAVQQTADLNTNYKNGLVLNDTVKELLLIQ